MGRRKTIEKTEANAAEWYRRAVAHQRVAHSYYQLGWWQESTRESQHAQWCYGECSRLLRMVEVMRAEYNLASVYGYANGYA